MAGTSFSGARTQLEMLSSLGPDGIVRELSAFTKAGRSEPRADAGQLSLPHLVLPDHHEVRSSDVMLRRLHGNLAAAANRVPEDFSELLLTPGVGARTIRALAMVAEVVRGAPFRPLRES